MNRISAIKNGNHLVFQQVYNEYHERLYYFIFKKTKSKYLTEEVVQIAFIKLWTYRLTLDEKLAISTQIFRIAITSLIDLKRKQQKQLTAIGAFTIMHEKNRLSGINQLDEKEVTIAVYEVISQLPRVQRQVFEMSRIEGLSHKEIAASLSISVKTVESHITKAIKKIKKKMPTTVFFI